MLLRLLQFPVDVVKLGGSFDFLVGDGNRNQLRDIIMWMFVKVQFLDINSFGSICVLVVVIPSSGLVTEYVFGSRRYR